MEVILTEQNSNLQQKALIELANKKIVPLKKYGWQFNWRTMIRTEGAFVYKLSLLKTPNVIEGMLMLTILYNELVFMNNIEIAPHNYGHKGKYKNVAGCLLAFACRESFEKGNGNYNGFLSFDSKTNLIPLYQKKYGASIAFGNKMFFSPNSGKNLMKKYLNIDY